MLWLLVTALMLAATAFVCLPFLRRSTLTSGASADIYRSQLAELEREEAAGLVTADDARLARTEVQRRLISTSGDAVAIQDNAMTLADRTTFIAVAGALAIGSAIIYGTVGSPGQAGYPLGAMIAVGDPAEPTSQTTVGPVDDMISKLEARLRVSPDDVEGWRMLGWSRFRTDDYAAAAAAYARAASLTPTDPETQSAYGEALVRAAAGVVGVEAEAALRAALKADPMDARARFLLGLKKQQIGDPKAALDDWIAMLKTAPADAAWYDEVRGRAVELSQTSGIDVAARLPPARASVGIDLDRPAGPSAADVSEAAAMAPEARQAMIDGMVARLDTKLKENPKDLDGWLRLIRARRVLGQADLAQKALADAGAAFASDASAQQSLRAAMSEPLETPAN